MAFKIKINLLEGCLNKMEEKKSKWKISSIEVKDNSGSILKADTNAVVVNKPISEYSFVTYKDKDYLWTKYINNIPDNYYEPMIVPIRFIIIRDNRFKVLATRIDPFNKEKQMFSQCLIQRIKE